MKEIFFPNQALAAIWASWVQNTRGTRPYDGCNMAIVFVGKKEYIRIRDVVGQVLLEAKLAPIKEIETQKPLITFTVKCSPETFFACPFDPNVIEIDNKIKEDDLLLLHINCLRLLAINLGQERYQLENTHLF